MLAKYGAHHMESTGWLSWRVKGGRQKKRDNGLHSPFALHAPIQWAIYGDMIKSRGGSNLLGVSGELPATPDSLLSAKLPSPSLCPVGARRLLPWPCIKGAAM